MVLGETGLGKSTLINSLFLGDLYKDRRIPDAAGACNLFDLFTREIISTNKSISFQLSITRPRRCNRHNYIVASRRGRVNATTDGRRSDIFRILSTRVIDTRKIFDQLASLANRSSRSREEKSINIHRIHVSERVAKTTSIEKKTMDIEERGVRLRLTIVDTPGERKVSLHHIFSFLRD